MPTVLEGIRESHEGPEPRVITADVQAILQRVVKPGDDPARSVAAIAERADVSTRTVYRVLQGDRQTISLRLADQLVTLGANSHLVLCRLMWENGSITPYSELRTGADLDLSL